MTQMISKLTDVDRRRVEAVIARYTERLWRARGFVGARPGFPVRNGALVRQPAIIAFVRAKMDDGFLEGDEALPSDLDGIPVDVVVADPQTELELRTGQQGIDPLSASFADPTYEGLPGDPIDLAVQVDRPVLCHVGPDSGWVVLRDFIAAARESLTAAIYDFDGEHIAESLIETSQAHGLPIKLAIDDSINDEKELPVQRRLKLRLQDSYDPQTVFCRSGARFPSAYHEKVLVRDGSSFWLSSGNWTRSSQPELDPVNNPDDAPGMYSKGNREWHVVVENEELSDLFARYIEHDRVTAQDDASHAFAPPVEYPDVFVPLAALLDETEAAALAAPVPVAPQLLPAAGAFTVRPLLSPDNYARRVRELIESAAERLYLQYSYITWTAADRDRDFREVLEHLAELSWRDADEFDLRIIVNSRDAAQKVRVLAENGFNEAVFGRQSRIHNKGIIADGKRVLVSSQNWSGDGFLRNRDAGVIIDNPEVAQYYEAIFLDDWDKRTKPALADGLTARLAIPGEQPPRGMVRLSWQEYFGD